MKSWRDDDLVLYLYGEHPRGRELELDLAARSELRERFEALQRDLAAFAEPTAPEPRPGLEDRVWARIRPRMDAPHPVGRRAPVRPSAWRGWRLAAVATVLVAAILGAYVAGRRSATPQPTVAADRPLSAAARDRILRASVADHLESSSMLLTDLTHATAGQKLADERAWAASLLAENRLYRQAAERAGQRRIVALLDELDPLLVELANGTAGDVPALQHRIDERGLLFKVRVLGSRLQPSNL